MTDHALREATVEAVFGATRDQRDQAWPIVNRLMGSLVEAPPPDDFEDRLERASLYGAAVYCLGLPAPVDDDEVATVARAVRRSYRADGVRAR